MTCAICGGSGRRPGSDYLDCVHCDAAEQIARRTVKSRPLYLQDLRPMSGKFFQHFDNAAQKAEHLAHVEKHKKETPF